MILVLVGASEVPFERLLTAVESLPGDEEIVVQCGSSSRRPQNATVVEYMPFAELVSTVRRARVVVTHAGVGSIMTGLAEGKRPLVVPRRHLLGEAVDDHQVLLARRLAEADVVTVVEDVTLLPQAVAQQSQGVVAIAPDPRLVDELSSFISENLAAGRPVA